MLSHSKAERQASALAVRHGSQKQYVDEHLLSGIRGANIEAYGRQVDKMDMLHY